MPPATLIHLFLLQPYFAIFLSAIAVARRSAHHGHGPPKPVATYDDLPSPQGSWQTNYEANQRKYNGHLALGVGFLAGTILFGNIAGLFELNWSIPEKPAVIDSYKE